MRFRAFGLDVSTAFPIAGVHESPHLGGGRALELELCDQLDPPFAAAARRISEARLADGAVAASVDLAPGHGYLIRADGFGRALMTADARRVLIEPTRGSELGWQRYLLGQVLPLAALLQGLEVFHASVVERSGRAIALAAGSGVGKTTVALELVRRGLGFLSDDVLAAEAPGERPVAHPAVGVANVRPAAYGLLAELERAGRATRVAATDVETRVSVDLVPGPLPLAALVVLVLVDDPHALHCEQLTPVDPRLLLAASFNVAIQTPERLSRQLDVCSRISRAVPVFRIDRGERVAPSDVADVILSRTPAG